MLRREAASSSYFTSENTRAQRCWVTRLWSDGGHEEGETEMTQIGKWGRAHKAGAAVFAAWAHLGTAPQAASARDPLGVGALSKTHRTHKPDQGLPKLITVPPGNTLRCRAYGLRVPWRPAGPHCLGSCLRHLDRLTLWHCARDPHCGMVPQGVAAGRPPRPICADSAVSSCGSLGWFLDQAGP